MILEFAFICNLTHAHTAAAPSTQLAASLATDHQEEPKEVTQIAHKMSLLHKYT